MRKTLLILSLMAASMSLQATEPQKTTVNVTTTQTEKRAEIKFETLNHDFGTFSQKGNSC